MKQCNYKVPQVHTKQLQCFDEHAPYEYKYKRNNYCTVCAFNILRKVSA